MTTEILFFRNFTLPALLRLRGGYVLLFIGLALLYSPSVYSTSSTDSLLNELSLAIKNKERYINEKKERLEALKRPLKDGRDLSLLQQYTVYNKLQNEYRTFKYDSAFTYVLKMQDVSRKLSDPAKITYSKLNLGLILLSSGMYTEALDSLNTIKLASMPDSIKVSYYSLRARAYYDLAGFSQDTYYSSRYIKLGESYIDSALTLIDATDMQFYGLRGMKQELENPEKARNYFQTILDKYNPSLNEYAMAANSLGNIYYKQGNKEMAIEMMARAAIADMKASIKEGVALMTLAEFLYNTGDESRAYDYIKQALEDASFYGAKQRKIQVAAILPIIEGERLATVEGQRARLVVYAIVVTLLSLLVIFFAYIILRQLKQLREAKRTVTEANNSLQEINKSLTEANIIKEEYIGYSFNVYTGYLDKIDKFKRSIDNKLTAKKYDEIGQVMKSINIRKEREAIYQNFDRIFIRLFPNFVSAFNSYFNEEDRIILKDKDCLTIELRIFALIRIGIHDHEQIAKILEYSVSTIYNYKTKVRNRSVLPNEEFEKRIMEIRAF